MVINCFEIRKRKSKSKSNPDKEKEREREHVKELLLKEDDRKIGSPSGSGRNSPAVGGSNSKKTEAERRFEETQKRRVRLFLSNVLILVFDFVQLAERVAKLAGKTHKDRVAEFNNHLESLSEHHDIPKVCTRLLPTLRETCSLCYQVGPG